MKKIILVLALAFFVAACSSAPTPSPQSSFVPPAPSTAVISTPTPTPVPSPNPGAAAWAAFGENQTAFWPPFNTDSSIVKLDNQMNQPASVQYDAIKVVQAEITTEIAWLKANQPAACYRDGWNDTLSGLNSTDEAMRALAEGLDINKANAAMAAATAAFNRVQGEQNADNANCTN